MNDYLVEFVYLGRLHEPFGMYHAEKIEDVIQSLQAEIDNKGHGEKLDNHSYKFTSPKNKESYWLVYKYEYKEHK